VPVKFGNPPSTSDVYIILKLTGTGVKDTAAPLSSTEILRVEHANVNLAGTTTPQTSKTVKYNRKVPITFPLTNNGNVPAKSKPTYDVFISTTQDIADQVSTFAGE
jgi:hypothetical protein